MKAVTAKVMRILEANARSLGVSTLLMMENAGSAVARAVLELGAKRAAVLAGRGNKAGDGFTAARHLAAEGCSVDVYVVGGLGRYPSEAEHMLSVLRKMRCIRLAELKSREDVEKLDLSRYDVLVDAMIGTGLRGELREPFKSAVEKLNSSGKPVVAVDIPTGLDPDLGKPRGACVKASVTVTMHAMKAGLVADGGKYSGRVVVANIGIPPEAWAYTGPGDVREAIPRRKPDSHKGDYGRLAVVGGSRMYHGAPILAAMAAMRTGVDLTYLIEPREAATAAKAYSPDLIALEAGGGELAWSSLEEHLSTLEKADAVVMGPGAGLSPATLEALAKLAAKLTEAGKPVVVDGDGLKALAKHEAKLSGLAVLTPHAGEFKLLSGEDPPPFSRLEERGEAARRLAKRLECTVLLKGMIDVVSDGEDVRFNLTGNPGMTVGGTGDVLAGVAGAMLCFKNKPMEAAAAAAYLTGLAGDIARERLGDQLLASDVVEAIPEAVARCLS